MKQKTIFIDKYRKAIEQMVQIRNARNLTQRDLAKILEVPHCYVGRVETFERRLDIIEMINWLKALKVSDKSIKKFFSDLI